jgi:hypothetical protein
MLSARILKGGALLEESRILVERWDLSSSTQTNLARLLDDNALAKRSRSRAADVLHTVLRPRLVDPGGEVIGALKELVGHPRGFTEACYFEACRADELLAAFAQELLWHLYEAGRSGVIVADAAEWLSQLAADHRIPAWSPSVQGRAARGLLATTRDFGVLRGAARKELAPPRLSPAGFAYAAFRLHQSSRARQASPARSGPRQRRAPATGLTSSDVWRRWLLTQAEVDQLFAEAAHLGVLRRSRAGSMVRLDWELATLVEVAHAVA